WVRFGFFALAGLVSLGWERLGGTTREGATWLQWIFEGMVFLAAALVFVAYRVRYRRWFGWLMLMVDVFAYNGIGWLASMAVDSTAGVTAIGAVPMIFGAVLAVAAAAVRQLRWSAMV